MNEFFSGWMFAGSAAALTLMAAGWGHVRNLYSQIAGRVVVKITVSGYQADAVLLYLKQHYVASRFGPRAYVGWKLFVRPTKRVQLVPMEVSPPSGRVYWRGWLPIWVAKSEEKLGDMETGLNAADYDYQTISIVFARGTLDCDKFVLAATEYFNRHAQDYESTGGRRHSIRFVHGTAGNAVVAMTGGAGGGNSPTSQSDIRACLNHRPLGVEFSELGADVEEHTSAVTRLALSGEAAELVEEVRRWRETEQWHRRRGLPWRRGYLLHGKPGTGKTALARAIAEDLDLPIFVYDLATLKNDELLRAWNQMLAEVPCMALIEDIDAVFHGRKNIAVSQGPALTFDCLLNCLDGVQRADGLLVMVSTNHLDKIDPAIGQPGNIGSRPGRIDRVVAMNDLSADGRRKLAERILDGWPHWIDDLCVAGAGDTPAQFQERCGRLAMKLHYGEVESGRSEELLEV